MTAVTLAERLLRHLTHSVTVFPLRGKGLEERRRLVRLSRSGERIDDPLDAELVHEFLDQIEALHSWGWKVPYGGVWPWIVSLPLISGVVLWTVRADWPRVAVALIFLIFYVAASIVIRLLGAQIAVVLWGDA